MKLGVISFLMLSFFCQLPWNVLADSEVLTQTPTRVMVREHPRTGKPFVSITANAEDKDPFKNQKKIRNRPDYRMLDPKMKSGKIPYDGPSSDRKKVYILAASLATIGTVGGVGIMAAAPAATGAGATGGAGAFAGAGAGIAAGTVSGSIAASQSDPKNDKFTHVSESREITSEATI